MMNKFILLLIFISFSAVAEDFAENFSTSAFNLKWNSSIEDAQFLFPNGNFRPLHSEDNKISFVVINDFGMTWYEIPTQEIYFTYSPKLKLDQVRAFFRFQDLDIVKRKCLDVFGADFTVKENKEEIRYTWKKNRIVHLSISTKRPTRWVYLYVK